MRKRVFAAFGAFSAVAGILSASIYYHADPLYVCRTAARSLVLQTVAAVVKVGDPAPPLKALTGPSWSLPPQSRSAFTALLGTLYPDCHFSVESYRNTTLVRSTYDFGYQPADDAGMKRLREKYPVVARFYAQGDFAGSLALMNWVHGQWPHGTKECDYNDFDADLVLTRAREGERYWCSIYAMTFVQLASSAGVQARLVGLSKDPYDREHAVAEVWSNEKGKWFVVDPDFNIWYSRDGVPLDALQINEALKGKQTGSIIINKGAQRPSPGMEERIPSLFELYRYFSIHMRNDWMTNHYFPGHPSRSDESTLFWDQGELPVLNLETKDGKRGNFYWDLNRTQLQFVPEAAARRLAVRLATTTPNFSHFEIVVDQGEATKTAGDTFFWQLHPGRNAVEVRSVNALGQKGIPAGVVLSLKPVPRSPGSPG